MLNIPSEIFDIIAVNISYSDIINVLSACKSNFFRKYPVYSNKKEELDWFSIKNYPNIYRDEVINVLHIITIIYLNLIQMLTY